MPFHKKKSKVNVLRIEQDIRALLEQRKSSQEIMDILSIPERTFRRYCALIYRQDQKTWASITKHQLASSLLKLRSSLEETYDISREMALDPKCEDRLGALASMNDARLSIIHLLVEYPDFIRKIPIATNDIHNPKLKLMNKIAVYQQHSNGFIRNETRQRADSHIHKERRTTRAKISLQISSRMSKCQTYLMVVFAVKYVAALKLPLGLLY